MSEWITDRPPTEEDADINDCVYNELGLYTHWQDIEKGRAWMPITPPEPYVKPKRFEVVDDNTEYYVNEKRGQVTWATVPVRDDDYDRAKEAAERIAAIYEEVMP